MPPDVAADDGEQEEYQEEEEEEEEEKDGELDPFAAAFPIGMTPAMVARAREIEAAEFLLQISNDNNNNQLTR